MKLYVETTVPNFLFADDSPDKMAITIHFFEWIKYSTDEFYISELMIAELDRAQPPFRERLLEAAAKMEARVLPISTEAEGLASRYVADRVVPKRYRDDALHVAIAVLNRMDVVVTWNMKHLANVRRIDAINRTNLVMGLAPIRIHTPEEVLD